MSSEQENWDWWSIDDDDDAVMMMVVQYDDNWGCSNSDDDDDDALAAHLLSCILLSGSLLWSCQVSLSPLCEWKTGSTSCWRCWLHKWPFTVEPLLWQEESEGPGAEIMLGCCRILCLPPALSWGAEGGCIVSHPVHIYIYWLKLFSELLFCQIWKK